VWLVPLFPLIGFLITGLGRNMLGKSAGWIASLAILASFVVSLLEYFLKYKLSSGKGWCKSFGTPI
jgi:NADH-quinone oxidoreductase subunit L